jgi:hypothetical protein
MSKIIKAYAEEVKKPSMSLIKSIENGLVAEGPFNALKSLVTGSKSAKDATTPDRATSDSMSETLSTNLNKIVDELLHTTDDRYVIFCTLGFVSKFYLKAGGGQGVIEQVKNDDVLKSISAFQARDAGFSLVKLDPKFQFTDLINSAGSSYNAAVILDIPKQLSDELEKAKSSGDTNKIRETLIKMMSHKYYVMTLNVPQAKKISADMDKHRSAFDEQVTIFNPAVIANYPVKNILDSAKLEWQDEHSYKYAEIKSKPHAEDAESPEGGTDKEGKPSVSKTPSGGLDLNKSIMDAVISGKGDADKIAQRLFFTLNKHFDLHTVENAIIELGAAFGGGILNKLNAILTQNYANEWERKQPAGDKSKSAAEQHQDNEE